MKLQSFLNIKLLKFLLLSFESYLTWNMFPKKFCDRFLNISFFWTSYHFISSCIATVADFLYMKIFFQCRGNSWNVRIFERLGLGTSKSLGAMWGSWLFEATFHSCSSNKNVAIRNFQQNAHFDWSYSWRRYLRFRRFFLVVCINEGFYRETEE